MATHLLLFIHNILHAHILPIFFYFLKEVECCTKKLLRVAQKSMLCRPKNISHRNYVAHKYDVVHKKIILWQQKNLCDTQNL